MSGFLFYHIFADNGVESEALSAHGRVVRVGIDPRDTNQSEPLKADANNLPLKPGADLALLHPPCQRWSPMTRIHGNPEDHPNLIPLAREIGEKYAQDYIIENVPQAPLEDEVVLDGRMFNLPMAYKRAFETSFRCRTPPMQHTLTVNNTFGSNKPFVAPGRWTGSHSRWKSVKGYSGDYRSDPFKRSAIPRAYIDYLLREWMDDRGIGAPEVPADD